MYERLLWLPRLILSFEANILIDDNGHACLADFGLLALVSDPANPVTSSSPPKGGTTQWMSPERLDPQKFGITFKGDQPTKESDVYALGMVIFEVLSGHIPFEGIEGHRVVVMVVNGKLPERPIGPEGVWFTDELWKMLQLCWKSERADRPSIENVLDLLGQISSTWTPPPLQADKGVELDGDDYNWSKFITTTTPNDSLGVVS